MNRVRLIIFDVDGTLTDGGVYFGPNGEEHKMFNVTDGLGIRLAQVAGLKIAAVSGRNSEAVRVRMEGLGAVDIVQGVADKRSVVQSLLAKYGLEIDEAAFVGDDLNDLPAFQAVGVRIAVGNAAPQLREQADYVTAASGGAGAAREAIEVILDAQGALESTIDRYVREAGGAA